MVTILKHPLLQSKMAILRDKNTGTKDFKEVVDEIHRHLKNQDIKIDKILEVLANDSRTDL